MTWEIGPFLRFPLVMITMLLPPCRRVVHWSEVWIDKNPHQMPAFYEYFSVVLDITGFFLFIYFM